jgi:hypothetical protein
MTPIDWAHAARVTVWTIIGICVYLGLALLVASWFARKVDQWEYNEWLRQQELQRERDLLAIADAIAAAPPKERQRIERVAESLGFVEPPRAA